MPYGHYSSNCDDLGCISKSFINCKFFYILTSARFAISLLQQSFLLPEAMLSRYMSSSCVCVCLLHSGIISRKTAKRRITQIVPHDRPETLTFLTPKIMAKFNWDHPLYGGEKCKWGGLKLATCDEKCTNSKTVEDRHIDQFLLKSNRKPFVR